MKLELIFEEQWNFALYRSNTDYYLSVLCGGVAMYEITIRLTDEEKKYVESMSKIKELVSVIQFSPNLYASRNENINFSENN